MMQNKAYDSIAIIGPTASGKTNLAVELAYELNGEILSIDSRMVFKGMDIGTGKDLDSYFYHGIPIKYHLIDICEPHTDFNIHQFQNLFKQAFQLVQTEQKTPILCGGSGLYLEAVIKDFNYTAIPSNKQRRVIFENMSIDELQQKLLQFSGNEYLQVADPSSHKRAVRSVEIMEYLEANPGYKLAVSNPINPLIIGLNPPKNIRWERIYVRLEERLRNGLIEEVETLLQNGLPKERLNFFGLEYKFVLSYLEQNWTKEMLREQLAIAIRQFAKRQMTYFRKMERSGLTIHWTEDVNQAKNLVANYFQSKNKNI